MLNFKVRSSSSDAIYELSAKSTQYGFEFTCTCPAGHYGGVCKHRLNLIAGSVENLVGSSPGEIRALQAMVAETDIPILLAELEKLEQQAAKLRRKISSAKDDLASAFRAN